MPFAVLIMIALGRLRLENLREEKDAAPTRA
jgi:hypothetical protein